MVLPKISGSEPSAVTNPTASTKSQPLHNFSFTGITWSSAHPRFRRRFVDSARREFNDLPPVPAGNTVHALEEEDKGQLADGRSNKIHLRLRKKEMPTEPPPEATAAQVRVPASLEDPDELTPNAWNLRPRRAISKKKSRTRQVMMGLGERDDGAMGMEIRSLSRSRSGPGPGPAQEEARRVSVSIPLTKEEVEADYLTMAAARPAVRPKKRPRKVQRALDNCFPGLQLINITPDLYKVPGDHPKVLT